MKQGVYPRAARGFTLIELVLAVAIIGILAAVAIPQFRLMQCRSHQAEVRTIMRQAVTAEQLYSAEFGYFTEDAILVNFGALDQRLFFGSKYYECFAISWLLDTSRKYFNVSCADTRKRLNPEAADNDRWTAWSTDGVITNTFNTCVPP